MEELQQNVKQLVLGLQELFECPVCFDNMDFKLKQCVNGHGVCSSCARKIDKCPTCRQELLASIRQNTLLGQVQKRLPKPCPYTDKGCDTVVFDQEHQTYCEYRPTECKNKLCVWRGCVKDLLDHVRNCGNGKGVKLREVVLNVEAQRACGFRKNKTKSILTPIICQNQVFWKCFHRNSVTKCISHKLYNIPTSKPTCNCFMVVSFKKGDIEFKHTCKASTDMDTYDEDHNFESGVIISDSDLQYFQKTGSENKYNYTFKLVKKDIP